MTRRTYIILIAALTLVAVVRVASTHRVFNATSDEPVHLAAGWVWLNGTYNIDLGHPPLARVLVALPLKIMGLPDPPLTDDTTRGNFLLYHGDRYLKNLARARSGNLLLFIAAILAVAELARRTYGRGMAVLAVALFTNIPSILAHAGVMTTDMAVTAALPWSMLALDLFLEKPTWKRTAALGLAIGMGVLAKFSFLVFFPACALVLLLVRRTLPRMSRAMVALVVAFFVTWGGYLFDFRTISSVYKGGSFFIQMAVPESWRQSVRDFSDNIPIPAPALPIGLGVLNEHDKHGHLSFLLGETKVEGWWYYFPVVFFFKTPIPFLILVIIGCFGLKRRGLEHLLVPLAVLLVSMTGSINIGVRHVLPMYAGLSIVAALGLAMLWRRTRGAFATLGFFALMAWLFVGVAAGHPDYLAWFNEAAGKRPWRIVADSNLDWGQDILRLQRAMRELRLERVWMRYSANVDLARHGIQMEPLPDHPVTGWIVLGETAITHFPDRVAWLQRYEPVRRVGKSMRLYYVP